MQLPQPYLPDYSKTANRLAQLGQTIGYNRQQNALASALPGAFAGDPNALSQLAKASPEAYAQVQSQLYQRDRDAAADMAAEAKAQREQKLQGLKWSAGAIVNAATPEEKARIYETQVVPHLSSLGFSGLPSKYDPSVEATANSILERFPEMPKAAQPTDDIQEFEFAQKNGFTGSFEQWMARKAQQGAGASPFYQFLPGADGYLVGNARTGQITPGMVNGQRAVPGALDPALQGALVTAKEGAKADVDRDTARQDRTRSADDALSLLDEAESILASPSTTGSVGGTFIDRASGAMGQSTAGAQSTARLKTIGGQLVAKMPRMEGPQSNYDVQLYRDMAGQLDDPTVPTATRMQALQQIRRLQEKYASQPQSPSGGGASGGWGDDAEVDALVKKYTGGR